MEYLKEENRIGTGRAGAEEGVEKGKIKCRKKPWERRAQAAFWCAARTADEWEERPPGE